MVSDRLKFTGFNMFYLVKVDNILDREASY